MIRLWPRTLAGRLVALVLLAVASAQLVAWWVFADERHWFLARLGRERLLEQLVPAVRLLAATRPEEHEAVLRALGSSSLLLAIDRRPIVGEEANPHHPLVRRLARELGVSPRAIRIELASRDARLFGEEEEEETKPWRRPRAIAAISIALSDGRWLNARSPPGPVVPAFARPYAAMLAILAGLLVLAVLVGTRRATRPLAELARAAETLGRGEPAPPLAERGPEEVRRAIAAFNRMQERLARFIADRTRLLAALGHDLRTPITSLRLRVELLEDEEAKQRMIETLDEMQRMVESTLAFAREEAEAEPVRETDLSALIEGTIEDLAELGWEVRLVASEPLVARIRTAAIRRAIRNLIENAVRYGGRARVALLREGEDAVVRIDDDGPGIPPDKLEEVFEPFVRLEASRSSETGGVGLGLSIARGIARAHGGDVTLANRPEGGLRASLRLPLIPRGGGRPRWRGPRAEG
ncbi:MAG: ATP-binding protein [Geminicoccaceae bacterium]|nr:ATP-binding protein [Geminicoccaceae bacterium]MCS7268937.1 ATP-binding protein [Geminicoccaceae bacterium]MDW8124855.1 ATP-binding protein [Geminicoccaceae bacterium]MDW8340807.1 ATP-binding protein [Geminicoccaceae bacterium]